MHIIPHSHRVYLMGDFHGHTERLKEKLQEITVAGGPSALILLGDYDAHTASDIDQLKDLLAAYSVDYYLLRGNHDNPLYWQDRGISSLFEDSYFHFLHELDCIQWGESKILTVNGAVSVDRTCIRFDRGNCWPDIEPVPKDAVDQIQKLREQHGEFDVLISHTGIIIGKTIKSEFTKSFASTDETLLEDLEKERDLMQRIQIASGVERHYFGHFHQSWRGEKYDTDCRCLDICEIIRPGYNND